MCKILPNKPSFTRIMKRQSGYKFHRSTIFFSLILWLSIPYISFSSNLSNILLIFCRDNSIKYSDRIYCINPPDTSKNNNNNSKDSLGNIDYLEGKSDGRKFHNTNSAFTASFLTTSLIPPVGLVTTLIITYTPINESKIIIPYPQLKNNPDYYKGYITGARNAKITKSWLGFGSGLLFFGGIIFTINYIYLQ